MVIEEEDIYKKREVFSGQIQVVFMKIKKTEE